jgi:hypothetical protein
VAAARPEAMQQHQRGMGLRTQAPPVAGMAAPMPGGVESPVGASGGDGSRQWGPRGGRLGGALRHRRYPPRRIPLTIAKA